MDNSKGILKCVLDIIRREFERRGLKERLFASIISPSDNNITDLCDYLEGKLDDDDDDEKIDKNDDTTCSKRRRIK